MVTKLIVVTTSQCVHTLNHYVIHLKLKIVLNVNYTSIKTKQKQKIQSHLS